jgi:hypothetical protein
MQAIQEAVSKVDGVIKNRRKSSVNISSLTAGRVDVTVSFWIDTFKTRDNTEKIRSNVFDAVQQLID